MTERDLNKLKNAVKNTLPDLPVRPAAVLVPLVEGQEGLALLFEVRAKTLRTQPSQICFPGGGMEAGETPEASALRESLEELGLTADRLTVLGQLPTEKHSSGRTVYPIAALLSEETLDTLTPSPDEVDHWFTVPVAWFQTHPAQTWSYQMTMEAPDTLPDPLKPMLSAHSLQRRVLYWQYQDEPAIWGMTARIIQKLLPTLATWQEIAPQPNVDTIWRLETNLDDTTGEALGLTMELLLAAGARDVWYQPIFMKKNRPAYQLNLLCEEGQIGVMEDILFTQTTTIGIRRTKLERTILPRQMEQRETRWGTVRVKTVTLPNGSERSYPEYEDVAELSRRTGEGFSTLMKEIK